MLVKNIKIYYILLLLASLFSGGCSTLQSVHASFLSYISDSALNSTSNHVIQNFNNNINNTDFFVVGKGLAPGNATSSGQAKLMAERAAVSDGYRQLAERIQGTYVSAYTKSERGSINYDYIYSQTHSWMRGVEIIEIRQAENSITEAYMKLRVYY